jgi:hypothetical protein
LRRKKDFPLFLQARAETGIMPTKMSYYCMKAESGPTFLFGFAAWSRAQIREALAKLALSFERLKRQDNPPAPSAEDLDNNHE